MSPEGSPSAERAFASWGATAHETCRESSARPLPAQRSNPHTATTWGPSGNPRGWTGPHFQGQGKGAAGYRATSPTNGHVLPFIGLTQRTLRAGRQEMEALSLGPPPTYCVTLYSAVLDRGACVGLTEGSAICEVHC